MKSKLDQAQRKSRFWSFTLVAVSTEGQIHIHTIHHERDHDVNWTDLIWYDLMGCDVIVCDGRLFHGYALAALCVVFQYCFGSWLSTPPTTTTPSLTLYTLSIYNSVRQFSDSFMQRVGSTFRPRLWCDFWVSAPDSSKGSPLQKRGGGGVSRGIHTSPQSPIRPATATATTTTAATTTATTLTTTHCPNVLSYHIATYFCCCCCYMHPPIAWQASLSGQFPS